MKLNPLQSNQIDIIFVLQLKMKNIQLSHLKSLKIPVTEHITPRNRGYAFSPKKKVVQQKRRNVADQWINSLNQVRVRPTNNQSRMMTQQMNVPQQPSKKFRRQSCCCFECGAQTNYEKRIAISFTQTVVQNVWEEELMNMLLHNLSLQRKSRRRLKIKSLARGSQEDINSQSLTPQPVRKIKEINDDVSSVRQTRKKNKTITTPTESKGERNDSQFSFTSGPQRIDILFNTKLCQLSIGVRFKKQNTSKDDIRMNYGNYLQVQNQPKMDFLMLDQPPILKTPSKFSIYKEQPHFQTEYLQEELIPRSPTNFSRSGSFVSRRPTYISRLVRRELTICESDSSPAQHSPSSGIRRSVIKIQTETYEKKKLSFQIKPLKTSERIIHKFSTSKTIQKYINERDIPDALLTPKLNSGSTTTHVNFPSIATARQISQPTILGLTKSIQTSVCNSPVVKRQRKHFRYESLKLMGSYTKYSKTLEKSMYLKGILKGSAQKR